MMVNNTTYIPQGRLSDENVHDGLKHLKQCVETQEYKVVSLTVMSLVMVLIFFGNGLTIVSYFKFSGLRGIMYTLIVHLAVADIVLGCCIILYPLEAIFSELGENKYFCATRYIIITASFGTSAMLHLLFSLDRFLALKYPIKHMVCSKNKPLQWTLLTCVWIVNTAVAVGISVTSDYFNEEKLDMGDHFVCSNGAIINETRTIITSVTFVFLFTFDVVLYCVIIYIIRQSQKLRSGKGKTFNIGKLKMVIIIYCLMVVCWTPFAGTNIALFVDSTQYRIWCVREWLLLLGLANSGMNWVVYGMGSRKFKQAFKKILHIDGGQRMTSTSMHQPSCG